MNPIEVGDEKRLYYDVPIPVLPDFTPKRPTTTFKNDEEFVAERDRLLEEYDRLNGVRETEMEDVKRIEDEINARTYEASVGFKSSIPPYDAKQKKSRIHRLNNNTGSKWCYTL